MTQADGFDSAMASMRPYYSDLEWYAVDPRGRIAFLTTAGFGPVPMIAFRDRPAFLEASLYFDELPHRCGYTLHAAGPYRWTDWEQAAGRGLFGYDWTCKSGQYKADHAYELLATPEEPLILSDLPEPLRAWLEPIRFSQDFGRDLVVEREFSAINVA